MTSKEAIEHLMATGLSKYRIAKSLGLAPVSINQYLSGTKMSVQTAAKLASVHGLVITDSFSHGDQHDSKRH